MTYIEKGERVRLRPGTPHQCPSDRVDNDTARAYRRLTSRNQDTQKVTDHGWCLDRDLHGSRWWPNELLEVVE